MATATIGETLTPEARRARSLALFLLLITYTLSFIDRNILNILIEPIKDELELSDTQLGFLSGTAFAIFYATLGIPVARLADRGNRRRIIVVALTVWSAMTALCGLAQNFWQLAIARIGVGVGEAGSGPPSHSIIADLYPREERSKAMSIYALGVYIGGGLGTIIGGLVAEAYGWRTAFFVAGLPGILFAVVLRFLLVEPKRGASESVAARAAMDAAVQPSVADVFRHLWASRAARHLIIGVTLTSFVGYGKGTWGPAFLMRSHGLSIGEVGAILAPLATACGAAGVLAGGIIADRLSRRDVRWNAWIVAVAKVIAFPMWVLFYLTEDIWFAVPFYGLAAFLSAFYLGPTFAMVQSVTPLKLRATAAAVLLFVLNLIGLGLGPQLVGLSSDLLAPTYGTESLRYTLLFASVIALWAGFHYWRGGIHYARELAAVENR